MTFGFVNDILDMKPKSKANKSKNSQTGLYQKLLCIKLQAGFIANKVRATSAHQNAHRSHTETCNSRAWGHPAHQHAQRSCNQALQLAGLCSHLGQVLPCPPMHLQQSQPAHMPLCPPQLKLCYNIRSHIAHTEEIPRAPGSAGQEGYCSWPHRKSL